MCRLKAPFRDETVKCEGIIYPDEMIPAMTVTDEMFSPRFLFHNAKRAAVQKCIYLYVYYNQYIMKEAIILCMLQAFFFLC